MPYLNAVLNIFESNHPIANLLICGCCFSRWEKVFKDLADAFTERAGEAFEDQMWVRFGDCPTAGRGKVVAQEDIVQGEGGGGAVGKVGDCQGGGGTAVFV